MTRPRLNLSKYATAGNTAVGFTNLTMKVKGSNLANKTYRGFYMSAHVILNLLSELRKRDKKCQSC